MNWYQIKNQSEDTAEVWIYDFIGEDFFGEGISAKGFVDELNEITAPNIDLHINSPGGSVREGQAIHNAIARHPAKVTTYVDGLAASIASTVALAGDEVIMADNSLMMIHKAWTIGMGNADELHHTADVLAKHDQTIEGIYQRKSDQDLQVIQDAMAEETWFTAQEAIDFGLADSVEEGLKAVACSISPEIMARFKNAPAALKEGGDGGLVLGKATVKINGVELSEVATVTVINNNLHPDGASGTNSGGAPQEEQRPYDLELELIGLRKKE